MKMIHARGGPYEIGRVHGRQGGEEVRHSIATYQKMFYVFGGLEWGEVIKRARTFEDTIQAFDADLPEEMKGVADGAGVAYEDILALNVRSEILFMKTDDKPKDMPTEGCTAIGVIPELTSDKHVYHGQTWDWVPAQEKAMFIIRIIQPDKPAILMLTEGGMIGKIGMNSAGIGVTLNAMSIPGAASGVPLHIVLRGMLKARSLVDAMNTVIKNKCACAANFMLSVRDGEVLDIEVAGDDYEVLYPDDGICVHTNHYLSERLKSKYKDLNRDSVPSTHLRRGRARRLLRTLGHPISRGNIASILKDHAGFPEAICYHPNLNVPEARRGATVATILMDMTTGEMLASVGRPCENPFRTFKL